MHLIRSCIAEPTAFKDRRWNTFYTLFYSKRIGELKKLWNDIHSQLRLPQHDPIMDPEFEPDFVQPIFGVMHWRSKAGAAANRMHCK